MFRIAYGYHWPSDIAGGAFLGIVIVLTLFHWHRFLAPVLAGIFAFIDKRPGIAAVLGTIIVCEFSNGFHYSQFFVQLGYSGSDASFLAGTASRLDLPHGRADR